MNEANKTKLTKQPEEKLKKITGSWNPGGSRQYQEIWVMGHNKTGNV